MAHELSHDLKDNTAGKRHFKRFAVALTALVAREPLGIASPGSENFPDAHRVVIVNMSLTGLHFVSPEFFPVGSPLWIRFQLDETTLALELTLRHFEEQEFAHRLCYTCGAQFVRTPAIAAALPVIADFLLVHSGKPAKPLRLVSESVTKQPTSGT